MTQKMHAAFVTAFGKPLEFREVDIPTRVLARSSLRQRHVVFAIQICTQHAATGH